MVVPSLSEFGAGLRFLSDRLVSAPICPTLFCVKASAARLGTGLRPLEAGIRV
jgi:hypothetical protein